MILFVTEIVDEHNVDALTTTDQPWLCFLNPDVHPDDRFVRRVEKSIGRHPEFDVFHVNLKGEPGLPRTTSAAKLFKLVFQKGVRAPFASFIFRREVFRKKAVFRADGSLDPLATVLACAKEKPVRRVWLLKMTCPPPPAPADAAASDARVWERIELYRWSEQFFGEDEYPLGAGDRMDLFAAALAKLYPGRTEEDLKEIMGGFQVAQGPIRKRRAASALKSALKERMKDLQ